MKVEDAIRHIGSGVVYQPRPGAPREDGVIRSVVGTLAMVQYKGDFHAKATRVEDLELLTPESERGES